MSIEHFCSWFPKKFLLGFIMFLIYNNVFLQFYKFLTFCFMFFLVSKINDMECSIVYFKFLFVILKINCKF